MKGIVKRLIGICKFWKGKGGKRSKNGGSKTQCKGIKFTSTCIVDTYKEENNTIWSFSSSNIQTERLRKQR